MDSPRNHKICDVDGGEVLNANVSIHYRLPNYSEQGCCSTFTLTKIRCVMALKEFFSNLGELVFDYTFLFITIPMLICLALGIGFFYRKEETQMYKLYSLSDTPSMKSAERFAATFTPERYNRIIVSSRENILTASIILKISDLDAKIKNITVMRHEITEDEYKHTIPPDSAEKEFLPEISTFEDICIKAPSDKCATSSILDVYMSKAMYGQAIVGTQYPYFYNMLTKEVYLLDTIIGNATVKEISAGENYFFVVQNATAFQLLYLLDGSQKWRLVSSTFEKKLLDLLESYTMEGLELNYSAHRSMNDELYASSTMDKNDLYRLLLGISLLIFYSMLSKSTCNYRQKAIAMFMGILSSVLGYLGGAGMLYLLGVKHVPPAEATPFLVVGIGADDCFVLVSSYSLLFMNKSPREKIKLTLQSAGISITITTATNLVAFFIGCVSPYFSISVFCMTTAVSLGMAYFMCLTFFLGFLCIDARREEKRMSISEPKATACFKKVFQWGMHHQRTNSNLQGETFPSYDLHNNKSCFFEIFGGQNETRNNKRSCNVMEKFKKDDISTSSSPISAYDIAASIVAENYRKKRKELIVVQTDTGKKNKYTKRKQQQDAGWNGKTSLAYEDDEDKDAAESITLTQLGKIMNEESIGRQPEESLGIFGATNSFVHPEIFVSNRTEKQTSADCSDEKADVTMKKKNEKSIRKESDLSLNSNNVRKVLSDNLVADLDKQSNKVLISKLEIASDDSFQETGHVKVEEPFGNPGRLFRKFMVKYYGRWLCNPLVKAFVLIAFAIHFCVAAFGFAKMESGLSLDSITLPNSYLRDFYSKVELYLSEYGDKVSVFFVEPDEWENKIVQAQLIDLHQSIRAYNHSVALSNGMYFFLKENMESLEDRNRTQFNERMSTWLKESIIGKTVRNDFIFDEHGNTLTAWKFTYYMPVVDNTIVSYNQLKTVRNMLDGKKLYFHGEVHTPIAPLWESDPIILRMTLANLAIAVAAVTLISYLFIPGILSSTLAMIMIITVDFSLFGYMNYCGLKLNMLTMVNLLISIGYSVDYTVHMVHSYTNCKSDNNNLRMVETLVIMGYPLTDGMISTFLPVVVLATSEKVALITFFKMMTLVLIFAYAEGIILLPVLLSVLYSEKSSFFKSNRLKSHEPRDKSVG